MQCLHKKRSHLPAGLTQHVQHFCLKNWVYGFHGQSLANFGGGWLATVWPIQRVTGLGMAVLAAGLFALPLVRSYAQVMMYGLAMGIAGGVVTVVFFSVWGKVFGRTHLGRIQGFAQMMTVLASAVGPLMLAETLRVGASTPPRASIYNQPEIRSGR